MRRDGDPIRDHRYSGIRNLAQGLRAPPAQHDRAARRSKGYPMKTRKPQGVFHAGRFLVKQLIKRNTEYLKRTSSGKDLVFYCDRSEFQWHPGTTGFGGSEEAVINVARELAKLDWNVTVYNSCGHKPVVQDSVTYRPFWEFNPRDRQDVVILWRWPKPLDWDIKAERIFVELQDTTDEGAFMKRDRVAKLTRVFVRSQFHRSLYPNLPDGKVAVIPNGIDLTLLQGDEPKDPYLLINTSSVERSMAVLPKMFKAVKQRVPQARLQWAYGWGLFELFNATDTKKLQWMKQIQRELDDAGIETLGHLTNAEVGKLYQRGAILAYPTNFPETDCISVKKAQACGCVPVTTDFGALAENVQFGIKIPCKDKACGIDDQDARQLWIDSTVELLTNADKRSELAIKGADWARQFSWPRIAARWHDILRA
jgi:glycosyltransferase involved in cell wall biosynthesis